MEGWSTMRFIKGSENFFFFFFFFFHFRIMLWNPICCHMTDTHSFFNNHYTHFSTCILISSIFNMYFFFRFQVSALFRQMMKLRIKVKWHEWSLTFYTLNNSIMGKHKKIFMCTIFYLKGDFPITYNVLYTDSLSYTLVTFWGLLGSF